MDTRKALEAIGVRRVKQAITYFDDPNANWVDCGDCFSGRAVAGEGFRYYKHPLVKHLRVLSAAAICFGDGHQSLLYQECLLFLAEHGSAAEPSPQPQVAVGV